MGVSAADSNRYHVWHYKDIRCHEFSKKARWSNRERVCNLQKSRAFADSDQDVDHECKSLEVVLCSCLSSSDQSDPAVWLLFFCCTLFSSETVFGSIQVKKGLSYSTVCQHRCCRLWQTIIWTHPPVHNNNKNHICSHILCSSAGKAWQWFTMKVYEAKHSSTLRPY